MVSKKAKAIDSSTTHPTVSAAVLIEDLIGDAFAQEKFGEHPTPVMIWGQPGVGKSQIARTVGRKTGRPVVDIRLLLKDPTDLSGLPFYSPTDDKMHYAHPSDLPEVDGPLSNAILLLDELPAAPQAVQSSALQLVLEREIGTYKLPDGVMILAAGNRATDGASYNNMPTALRNRFRHYTMVVDTKSWLDWARESGIDVSIQALIRSNPELLNTFDPSERHVFAFATPRSWEFVSNEIKKVKQLRDVGIEVSDTSLFRRVASIVGEDIRIKFKAFYEDAECLPDPHAVVSGKIKTFNIDKTPMKYACSINLMYALRDTIRREERENEEFSKDQYNTYVDNAIRFLVDNIDEKDMVLSALWMANDPEYKIKLSGASALMELVDDPEYDSFFAAM